MEYQLICKLGGQEGIEDGGAEEEHKMGAAKTPSTASEPKIFPKIFLSLSSNMNLKLSC
jgi:hypothetical protein